MKLFDKLMLASSKRDIGPEGFMTIKDNRLARIGVLTYKAEDLKLDSKDYPNGVKVFRGEDELFSQETIDSFKSKSATLTHPDEFISTEDLGTSVGWSKDDIVRDGDFMNGSIVVNDKDGVKAIQDGQVEISLGYDCKVTPEKGSFRGQEYTHIQSNIRGNHIAIVSEGRCGSTCKLSDEDSTQKKGASSMAKFKYKDVSYEAEDQVCQVVDSIIGEKDMMEKRVQDAEKKCEDMEKKTEDMEKEMEDMEKEAKDMKEHPVKDAASIPVELLDQAIAHRSKITDRAMAINPKFETAGKSEKEIIKTVLQDAGYDVEGQTDDYLAGSFNAMKVEDKAQPNGTGIQAALKDHANADHNKGGKAETRKTSLEIRDEKIAANKEKNDKKRSGKGE